MLSKHRRLNLSTDYTWVAQGKKTENPLLKVFFRKGTNQFPKLGIALSKNYFKKSSERTLARRRTSAAFEALYLRLERDINIIALPKSLILEKSTDEVISCLEELLGKENLLNNEDTDPNYR